MLLLLTSPVLIYNFTARSLVCVDCEKLKFLIFVVWSDQIWGTGCYQCAGLVCVMWTCSNKSRSHVYSVTYSPVYRASATILSLDLDVLMLHLSLYTVALVVVIVAVVIVFVVIIIVLAVVQVISIKITHFLHTNSIEPWLRS